MVPTFGLGFLRPLIPRTPWRRPIQMAPETSRCRPLTHVMSLLGLVQLVPKISVTELLPHSVKYTQAYGV